MNVALADGAGADGRLERVVDALERQVARLRRARQAGSAFVQRKDPDLRFRAEWRGGPTPVRRALTDELGRLRESGLVTRYFASVYEPESSLFGGDEALAACHDHFAADTRLLARWHHLAPAPLTPAVFSLALLNDLFFGALDGRREEVWDVWCRLGRCHGEAAPASRLRPITIATLAPAIKDRAWLRVLNDAARANRRLAERLVGLWRGGRLEAGLRSVLATVALFHWNRHGLAADTRAALYGGMRAALSPHGDETS